MVYPSYRVEGATGDCLTRPGDGALDKMTRLGGDPTRQLKPVRVSSSPKKHGLWLLLLPKLLAQPSEVGWHDWVQRLEAEFL